MSHGLRILCPAKRQQSHKTVAKSPARDARRVDTHVPIDHHIVQSTRATKECERLIKIHIAGRGELSCSAGIVTRLLPLGGFHK